MIQLTEKQIENSILAYLELVPGCLCYKNNNVGVYDPTKGTFRKPVSRFLPNGVSDIYGSYYGKAVYIEVKTPKELAYIMKHYQELRSYMGVDKKKNRYKSQIEFIEINRNHGCIAFFADSIDAVKAEFAKLK